MTRRAMSAGPYWAVSDADANLRARCLLASAAQQYLDGGDVDFPEVQALLGGGADTYYSVIDFYVT